MTETSKSFLIDTIMKEKQKLILCQPTTRLTTRESLIKSRESSIIGSRESSPDLSSRYIITTDEMRYIHSPCSSPRTPPTPHAVEHRLIDGTFPTNPCSMRCPSMCTSCRPHSHSPHSMCKLCESNPATQKLYQHPRESCSQHRYRGERNMFPITPISTDQRLPYAPSFCKYQHIIYYKVPVFVFWGFFSFFFCFFLILPPGKILLTFFHTIFVRKV